VSGRAIVRTEAIVAGLTEAPERAEPERIVVAMMAHDVISDACSRHATSFKADLTQGLDPQLVAAAALPACHAIPAMNFGTMRHHTVRLRLYGGAFR
jgi:hypothetical protein